MTGMAWYGMSAFASFGNGVLIGCFTTPHPVILRGPTVKRFTLPWLRRWGGGGLFGLGGGDRCPRGEIRKYGLGR